MPEHWTRFTPTLRSLFQKYLEIRSIKRADVAVLPEYLDAPWSLTGPPLEKSGSTNASGVISTCNASGSASTLTCASSNQHLHPANFSSSIGSSVICQHHHPHQTHQTHNHVNEDSPPHRDRGNDKTSCNSGSSDRAVNNSTNPRISSTILDDVYKDNPLKTSGALYSPLLGDEVCEQAATSNSCNRQNNPDQESQRPVRRCHHNLHHHHHHHLHSSDDKIEKKCPCRQSKKANPATYQSVKESCAIRLVQGKEEGNANEELDPETRFRLERVNRWIMNQMT